MNQEEFTYIVNQFKTRKDQDGNHLNIHYLLINQGDDTFSYAFNKRTEASDIRSISKTVMTLLAGILMDLSAQGKYPHFDENTYIYPILKGATKLGQVQVKHLISHTIGYDQKLLMRGDITHMDPFTYLDYLLNEPLKYEPGDYYLYSNAGFYLLSALLQEFIKEDLLAFAHRHLFGPLGIKDYSWEKYGDYLAGATRLKMFPEDLLKIGQVLISQGVYNHKRIVSKAWIEKMLIPTTYTNHVDTPGAIFRRYAYGSGIWLAKEPIFFGHGTDGQTLVMIPEKDTIIITLSHQHDVRESEKIINDLIVNIKNTDTL